MNQSELVFAYFGPETVLPVTSIIATAVGLVLMFGRFTVRLVGQTFRALFAGPRRAMSPSRALYRGPHASSTDHDDRQLHGRVTSSEAANGQRIA